MTLSMQMLTFASELNKGPDTWKRAKPFCAWHMFLKSSLKICVLDPMREWLESKRIIALLFGLLSSQITSPTMKKIHLRSFPFPLLHSPEQEPNCQQTSSDFQQKTKWNDGWGGDSLAWEKPSLCAVFLFPVTRQADDSGDQLYSFTGYLQGIHDILSLNFTLLNSKMRTLPRSGKTLLWCQETCFIKCSPCKAVTVNLAGSLLSTS